MRSKLRAVTRLNWRKRLLLAEAAAALACVWCGLRVLGYGRTRALLAQASPPDIFVHRSRRDIGGTVAELAWSVSAVAHHGPLSTTCLERTLALWWLLQRRGIESDVRIGTARTAGGLAAHAWLERDGVVLNDDVGVGERFTAFERLR